MRYLVLSDIHSNLEALEEALRFKDYDEILVLGDLVGYGANPNECVERVRALQPRAVIRGNHDKVACGIDSGDFFVSHALVAAIWTREQLSDDNIDYLRNLVAGPLAIDEYVTIAHGAPGDEDAYILSPQEAENHFWQFTTPICLIGHTHVAQLYAMNKMKLDVAAASDGLQLELVLDGVHRYMLNPGSVGQPRDGDARGAFMVLDTTKRIAEYHRFVYDIATAQTKIRNAGMPEFLAQRLAQGR